MKKPSGEKRLQGKPQQVQLHTEIKAGRSLTWMSGNLHRHERVGVLSRLSTNIQKPQHQQTWRRYGCFHSPQNLTGRTAELVNRRPFTDWFNQQKAMGGFLSETQTKRVINTESVSQSVRQSASPSESPLASQSVRQSVGQSVSICACFIHTWVTWVCWSQSQLWSGERWGPPQTGRQPITGLTETDNHSHSGQRSV